MGTLEARRQVNDLRLICGECSVDIGASIGYYSVHDHVWEIHGNKEGGLCIGCLESRMGRKLHIGDLKMVPINIVNPYTRDIIEKSSEFLYSNGIKENHHDNLSGFEKELNQ